MSTDIPSGLKFVSVLGEELQFFPDGSLFWERHRLLMVADLHLGKSTTFRRNGIPVPEGATLRTLVLLSAAIERSQPSEVVILGDMIHARCGWDTTLEVGLTNFFERIGEIRLSLIEGNHDRGSLRRLEAFPMAIQETPQWIEPFCLAHDESKTRLDQKFRQAFIVAGHLHPSCVIGSTSADRKKLKCFWLTEQSLILPSFGEFTGSKNVHLKPRESAFVLAGDEIIELRRHASTLGSA
jgi:DNA ligase-associated metallophosphoesterase